MQTSDFSVFLRFPFSRAYRGQKNQVLIVFIYHNICLLAPSSPPIFITADAINSTAISLQFQPPLPINQNGPITSFNVTYQAMLFQTQIQHISIQLNSTYYPLMYYSVELQNLEEYDLYYIQITAMNAIGSSPVSYITVRTQEARELNI